MGELMAICALWTDPAHHTYPAVNIKTSASGFPRLPECCPIALSVVYSNPGAATSKYAAATGSPKSYSFAKFSVLNLARLAGIGTWIGTSLLNRTKFQRMKQHPNPAMTIG